MKPAKMNTGTALAFGLLTAALVAGPRISWTQMHDPDQTPNQASIQTQDPTQNAARAQNTGTERPSPDAPSPEALNSHSLNTAPSADASGSANGSGHVAPADTPVGARDEAMQMVPAAAALQTGLDAKKMQPGAEVQAALTDTVHLKDGTELPRGTRLIGSVTADDMAQAGQSSLAVSFTQAQLKDGTSLPIKATITDVKEARPIDNSTHTGMYALQQWDGQSLIVDESGAISGVDLHSRIAGQSSGVFITPHKDDVKVASGTQLELALARS